MSLLLISGSLRDGSTNTALLRTAQAIDPDTELFAHMVDLPHFSPDDDGDDLPAAVADLRAAVGRVDAILVCTPEYAGACPARSRTSWSGWSAAARPTASRSPGSTSRGRPRPAAGRTRTTRCARSSAT